MTCIRGRAVARIATLTTVVALACGDGSPTGETGSIQVAVNPAMLSVEQGGSGSVTVSLTRGGGFSGVVTLAITGLPTGVTATITPAQLSGTTTNATVNVTVVATVAPGTYTATITATAQGVGQATTTYQLTVTAAADYALTVSPTALTILGGTSSSATVGVDRSNFTGEVALALLNPPAGITGAFNPTPSTTNASGLVVSVGAHVAPGNYPLTIQGTATGPGVKTATLTVTVPPPPTGGNVEYLFCDAADVPVFFGYQDGNGPWQAVTAATSGGATRFVFNLTQGHGGVLSVYQISASAVAGALVAGRIPNLRQVATGRSVLRDQLRPRFGVARDSSRALSRSSIADGYQTYLVYGSTAELAQDGRDACVQPQPTKTITGTVAGVPPGAYGIVSLGGPIVVFDGAASTNPITFTDVPTGLVDLVGSRTTPGAPPDKIIVFRNLDIPDGGVLPSVIDFNGPASSAPATATATITGGAGDNLEIFTDVVTANGRMGLWFDLAPSQTATRPWAGLGPATLRSGDFHGLIVFASAPDGSGDFRVALKYVGPVANQALALGPALSSVTTSQVVAGAYPRFRFQGTLPAEYNKGATIDVLSSEGSGNVFSILVTGAYLTASGNTPAYDFTMPDVIGLAGFPAAAGLAPGTYDLTASAFGFTGPGIFDLRPTLGSEFKAATKNATINVP